MPKTLEQERLGEISYNTHGSKMEIIKYEGANDLTVQFDDGYSVRTSYTQFLKGFVKNPNDISIFGIGYIGEGKYKSIVEHIRTKCYTTWKAMIQRCYNEKHQIINSSYIGCTVDPTWLNFQNFAEWYDENYYEVNSETMSLDKDILYKGNKIYSPKNCTFTPQRINSLFVKRDANRGLYPIGVSIEHRTIISDKFQSSCRDINNIKLSLGEYNTPEEAFNIYKEYKENVIKEVAINYKPYIPKKLYVALINYKVEITD